MAIDAWLTPAAKSGTGNTNVNLTASKNTAASRSTIVTVFAGGITKTINCIQVEADKFTINISALTTNSSGTTITNIGDCSIGSSASGGIKTGTYYRDTIVTLTAVSAPTGYDFIGWYEGVNLVSSSLQFTVTLTANRTLVAKYRIKSYTVNAVSADINTGTVSPAGQTVEHGANATVTASPKTAYNFDGWYNGATKVSSSLSYTFAVTTNANLTAKFIIKIFTTTTANNTGGTASVNVGSVNYGGSAIWTASPSIGYHFLKWSNDLTANPLTVSNITANTHITPIFEINSYTVTWNANGGNVNPASVVKTHGATLGALPVPTRVSTAEYSYTFAGWFTASSGGSQINANTIVTGNVTYYAQWTATKRAYTVAFNGNGGNNASSIIREYGATLGSLPSSSRTGHTFTGWWTAASGGTQVSASTIVYGDVTYYAQWSINNYTLYYNANGGSVSPASKVIQYGGSYGALPTPTRSNTAQYSYSFKGWFTAASGGTQVSTGTTIGASDVTIYAQWNVTTNRYTLTVNNGSGGGTYDYGTVVTLTANSIAHQIFTGWSDGVTASSRQVTVTGNATYTAQYRADSHTITVNSNSGGTVSGGGTFTHGTSTTIVASPSSGYHFVSWSDGGAQSHAVIADSDKTITATFAQDPYLNLDKTSLTFEASGGTQTVNITSNVSWSVS